MNSTVHRALVLAVLLLVSLVGGGCRSTAAPPPQATRTPIEKPWTREAIESHTYLWIELSSGKHGIMTGPVFAADERGEYLTTKADATVRLDLADIVVLEALDIHDAGGANAPGGSAAAAGGDESGGGSAAGAAVGIGGWFAAIWVGILFLAPSILLVAWLA